MAATVPIFVGCNYQITLAATKNGVPWDLTGATVTLYLVDPAGGVHTFACTIVPSSAGVGQAVYVTTTTDILLPGLWRRDWLVTLSGITARFGPVKFQALAFP